MLNLLAKIRKIQGRKVKNLREEGVLPAVLYGPKLKTESLEVNLKEFEKVFREAGESTLVSLEIEGKKDKYLVLIHSVNYDPLTDILTHIDFYQPLLTEKIEVKVPIIIEGEAPAVKNLGGTLIKNILELEVKALPEKLPKDIKINVGGLETFEDNILVKDIKLAEGIKILRDPNEVIVHIVQPEKVEEELAKPVEEKVEDIERVETKKKEEVEEVEEVKEKKEAKKENE